MQRVVPNALEVPPAAVENETATKNPRRGRRKPALAAVFDMLPQGRTLDLPTWERRHGWIMRLVWLHAAALTLVAGFLPYSWPHRVGHFVPVLGLALLATRPSVSRRLRAVSACLALLTCSAMLVHLTHGLIESHFHFFVAIAFLCLYEDWLIFVVAVAFVLLHHGIGGALAPGDVFDHGGSAWSWALIHAGFVAAAGVANVVTWRQNEQVRLKMAGAYEQVRASQERLSRTFGEAPIGMCLVGLRDTQLGRVVEVNRGLRKMLDLQEGDLLSRSLMSLFHPDDMQDALYALERLAAGLDSHVKLEARFTRPDGRVVWARASMSVLLDEAGAPLHAIGQIEDVTEQHRAERYRRAQDGMTAILTGGHDLAPEAVVELALPVLGEALGCSVVAAWWGDEGGKRASCTHTWTDGGRASDDMALAMSRTTLNRGEGLAGHTWASGKPQHARWMQPGSIALTTTCALPLLAGTSALGVIEIVEREARPADELLMAMLATLTDRIAQFLARRRMEEELSHRALHDSLTGLPNRALFVERLEAALEHARDTEAGLAVLFLDLDGFKLANDTLGHAAGDELLVAVSQRLRDSLRPSDTAARFGGDEFTVLCPGVHASEVEGLAVRIAEAVGAPCQISDQSVVLSASIGMALSPDGREDAETLMANADAAMYQAKANGKACHRMFDNNSRRESDERLQLIGALRGAVAAGEMRVFFQPIVGTEDGAVIAFEALARWSNPERGLLMPGQFIPLAEQSGLVVPLGQWVLVEACRQAMTWPDGDDGSPAPSLNVNLSAAQLADADIVDRVHSALESTGLPPNRLCLEVTESSFMTDVEKSVARLAELRRLGVRIAIDDFGSGFSSLSQLRRLPVDVLKVDRAFVTGIPGNREDIEIVAAIIALAQALDIEVVVEGIESAAQATTIRELGCSAAQGFYFGVPHPAYAVGDLLSREFEAGEEAGGADGSGELIEFPVEGRHHAAPARSAHS